MKRVLQVISSLHGNGTETAIMNIYRKLDTSHYQFDFLVFDDSKMDFYDEIIKKGGKVYIVPSRRRNLWGYIFETYNFFKRNSHNYAVVHYNFCYLSLLWPFLLGYIFHIKKRVIHSHSSNYVGSKLNLILHKLFRRLDILLSNQYVACSKEAKVWFYKSTNSWNKVKIIINGIDLTKYFYNETTRTNYRKDLKLDKNTLVLGQIGYFSEVKNHQFSLKLLAELKKCIPNIQLLLIGEGGALENYIKSEVEKLGLQENVKFLGRRNDVHNLLQAIDILIHPSLFEGLPLTLVEAQAANLPVLSSETVSRDSQCSPLIQFLPINNGIEVWKESILSIKDFQRNKIMLDIKKTPFNIENTTSEILKLYN